MSNLSLFNKKLNDAAEQATKDIFKIDRDVTKSESMIKQLEGHGIIYQNKFNLINSVLLNNLA